ncbi:hypothetical protein [Brevundimonas faecalis]|uniref:Uncharacterized protein n=1 Tax=Brevundimonas faecalis TaxID=947378 RepID=A0ABV2RDM5_9CAUL
MENMYRTHKEPAWGWIGALLEARRLSRPVATKPAAAPKLRPGRVAC